MSLSLSRPQHPSWAPPAWLQNKLLAVVLLMVVAVPLLATPADHKFAGVAALTFEGLGIVLLGMLLWRNRFDFSRSKVVAFVRTGANLPALMLLAWSVVSCAMSPHKVYSIQQTLQLGAGVLLYFAAAYKFRQSKHLAMLVDALLFLAITVSLLGMAQFTLTNGDARGTVLFGNQQVLGSLLMVLLPIAAVIAMTEQSQRRQLAAQVTTVLTAGCLMLAHTRSAWMGAAAGMATLGALALLPTGRNKAGSPSSLLARKHQFAMPGLMALLAVGFVVLVGLQNPAVVDRAHTLNSVTTDASWLVRQQEWRGAVQMIKARPLTGWGAGLFPVYQHKFTGIGRVVSESGYRSTLGEQAHNYYLQTAAELGLPGLVLMIAVLAAFWGAGIARLRSMDPGIKRSLLLGCLAASVAFSVDAFSSPSWQFGQVQMFLWLLLGLGVSCARPRSKRERAEEVPEAPVYADRLRRPFALGACAALLALLPTAMVSADGSIYPGVSSNLPPGGNGVSTGDKAAIGGSLLAAALFPPPPVPVTQLAANPNLPLLAGDTVQLQIGNSVRVLTVDADGQLDVPGVGLVQAAGVTPAALSAGIKNGLYASAPKSHKALAKVQVKKLPARKAIAQTSPKTGPMAANSEGQKPAPH